MLRFSKKSEKLALQSLCYALVIFLCACEGNMDSASKALGLQEKEGSQITFSPPLLAFDGLYVGQSNTMDVLVKNLGSGSVTINSQISNDVSFVVASTTCTGVTLTSDSSGCKSTIEFSPTEVKDYASELKFSTVDEDGSVHVAALPLTAIVTNQDNLITSTPSTGDFGSVATSTTETLSLVLSNSADTEATLSTAVVSGNGFALTSNGCENKTLTGKKKSCTVVVSFSPSLPGSNLGQLVVAYKTSQSSSSLTVTLTGYGDLPQPELTASPDSWNFGSVATNASGTKTFTVSNNTAVSAYTQTASISGSNFSITSDSCSNITLSSGSSCSISTSFSPAATGSATAVVTIPFLSSSGIAASETINLGGTGVAPSVAFSFAGFSGGVGAHTSSLTATGVVLSWTAQAAASYYKIFKTVGATTSLLTTITPSTTASYSVSGLTPAETYTFKINAYDASDISDGNSNTVSVTTDSTTGATFSGWKDVIAVGPVSTNIGSVVAALTAATNITSAAAQVKIAWEAFTFSPSGTATGYVIYRSSAASPVWPTDYTAIDTIGATEQYTDNAVTTNTYYYYRVHPQIGASVELTPATVTDSVIQIFVPGTNMALVHRWIANREVCTKLLGKTWPTDIDRDNNYRCAYAWGAGFAPQVAAADKTRWDLKYSLEVDRWENGCAITATGPIHGSDGGYPDGVPASGTGSNGDVYLGRSNRTDIWNLSAVQCAGKFAGNWYGVSSNSISNAQRATIVTNAPGYVPVRTGQGQSYNVCQTRTVAGSGAQRLFRLHEKIAAAAWTGTFVAPSAALLAQVQQGADHTTYGSCNVNTGAGLPNGDNNFWGTPGNGGWRLMLAGSWATRNCRSRYEIYDLVGNMPEWTSEQFTGCQTANTCKGSQSGLDSGSILLEDFIMDGTLGYAFSASTGWNPGWDFTTLPIVPMLGLPAASVSATVGSRILGATFAESNAWGKFFDTNAVSSVAYDGYASSGVVEGNTAGRLSWKTMNENLSISPTHYNIYTGFRCVGQVLP